MPANRRTPLATIKRSDRCLEVAKRLADRMGEVGLDKIRGGIFDCVERNPSGGMPTQFAWGATKDFWQQEQGILAYLILYGATNDAQVPADGARSRRPSGTCSSSTANGRDTSSAPPRTACRSWKASMAMKSSHAIGYHAFELAYLAHLYTRAHVAAGGGSDNSFCLYFKICSIKQQQSINVLPDFMPPGRVRIASVRANGVDVTEDLDPANLAEYQIPTDAMTPDPVSGAVELVVEFHASPAAFVSSLEVKRLRWPTRRSPARRSPYWSKVSTSPARSGSYQERFASYGAKCRSGVTAVGKPQQTLLFRPSSRTTRATSRRSNGSMYQSISTRSNLERLRRGGRGRQLYNRPPALFRAGDHHRQRCRGGAQCARGAFLPPGDGEPEDHQRGAVPCAVAADALARHARRSQGDLQSRWCWPTSLTPAPSTRPVPPARRPSSR